MNNFLIKPIFVHNDILRVSCAFSVLVTVLLVLQQYSETVREISRNPIVSGLLGVLGASGSLYLFFMMLRHCIRNRKVPAFNRIMWIISFLIIGWVGSIFYYIIVYHKDETADRFSAQH